MMPSEMGHPKANWLDVDRHAFDTREAVEQTFGERGVGVNGEHHLFDGGFEFDGGHALGDDLRGLGADDMDAQDLTVPGVGDDLDEAIV